MLLGILALGGSFVVNMGLVVGGSDACQHPFKVHKVLRLPQKVHLEHGPGGGWF